MAYENNEMKKMAKALAKMAKNGGSVAAMAKSWRSGWRKSIK